MSRAWSWRHAIAKSELQPNTRFVLMMLSIHMNEMGEGCFPSVGDLVNETGLDKKTVLKHLALAEEAGWIAVSNMGLRGQKWKQRSYVAAWPERGLAGADGANGEGEAGGMTPPALDEKQGESFPEAGGMVPPKQGEQFHQDNIVPVTSNKIPERESARERDRSLEGEEGQTAKAGPDETPKGLEKRFRALEFGSGGKSIPWPNAAGSSSAWGLKQFVALSPEDRRKAEELRDAYLAICPKVAHGQNKGQPKPVALGVYLRDRKFLLVEAMPKRQDAEEAKADRAPPFGPAWGAKRMSLLLGAPADLPERQELRGLFAAKYEVFSRSGGGFAMRYAARCGVEVSPDGTLAFPDDFEEREIARRTLEGFPGVNALDRAARDRKSEAVEPVYAGLAGLMEPVPVDSEMFRRWEDWHADHNRPFVPETGNQRVVFFPKGGPEGLEAFKRAVQAAETSDKPEAAE